VARWPTSRGATPVGGLSTRQRNGKFAVRWLTTSPPETGSVRQRDKEGTRSGNFIEASDFPLRGISVRLVGVEFFYIYLHEISSRLYQTDTGHNQISVTTSFYRLGVYTFCHPLLVGRRGCLLG
jgi:hypothetical protein